jgi:histidine ammonia-lyase
MSLSDLRSIYRGAPIYLDSIARPDVEAGAAALQALASDPTPVDGQQAGPSSESSSESAGNGEQLPAGIVRLIFAIKLGSLGQGYSGVRWAVLERMADTLSAAGPLPIRDPRDDDRAIMAALADQLVAAAGSTERFALPITSSERAALLSGSQVPAAFALAGLFEAERVLQSALVSSALVVAALGGETSRHPRVHKLHGYPGEMEVAAAMRSLYSGAPVDPAGRDPGGARNAFDCGPDIARMGACLDLLRQAGATLELAANAVSEDRLVFWFSQQMAAGFEDSAAIALAADMIAVAMREIGNLTRPRIAKMASHGGEVDPSRGPTPAWAPMVTTFSGENERQACPARDGGENGQAVGCSAGRRRLLPMAGTTTLLVAIELLAASPIINPAALSGTALDSVLALLNQSQSGPNAPTAMPAGGLPGAAELVRSGAIVQAAAIPLPAIASALERKTPAPSGAGASLGQSGDYAKITKAV